MIGKIKLYNAAQCGKVVSYLKTVSTWREGISPGKKYSERVKRNLELYGNVLSMKIANVVIANPNFSSRTIPKHVALHRFNWCKDGGYYGFHADSAFMGKDPEIRTDFSMTLFLTDDYEGGELTLHYPSGEIRTVKEPKGTLVFYPSTVMHEVTPVTKGDRICWIAWAQSHIKDTIERNILVDITRLCKDMEPTADLSKEYRRLVGIKHNLFRKYMP